jgi:hypothetical protein
MALAVVAAADLYLMIAADFRIAEASQIGYPAVLLLLLELLVLGAIPAGSTESSVASSDNCGHHRDHGRRYRDLCWYG